MPVYKARRSEIGYWYFLDGHEAILPYVWMRREYDNPSGIDPHEEFYLHEEGMHGWDDSYLHQHILELNLWVPVGERIPCVHYGRCPGCKPPMYNARYDSK